MSLYVETINTELMSELTEEQRERAEGAGQRGREPGWRRNGCCAGPLSSGGSSGEANTGRKAGNRNFQHRTLTSNTRRSFALSFRFHLCALTSCQQPAAARLLPQVSFSPSPSAPAPSLPLFPRHSVLRSLSFSLVINLRPWRVHSAPVFWITLLVWSFRLGLFSSLFDFFSFTADLLDVAFSGSEIVLFNCRLFLDFFLYQMQFGEGRVATVCRHGFVSFRLVSLTVDIIITVF
jgi:hypothetical protein